MPESTTVVTADLWGFLACVVGVAAVTVFLRWLRGRRRRVLESLLLLQTARPRLDPESVVALVRRALGIEVSEADETLVRGNLEGGAAYVVVRKGYFLEILSEEPAEPPVPTEGSEVPAHVFEGVRFLTVIRLIGNPRKITLPAFVEMGRLFGELFDATCVALVTPDDGSVLVVEDELRDMLGGPALVSTFLGLLGIPVPVPADDPEILAAIEAARRRWAEFVAAFADRDPEGEYAVKAAFGDTEVEHLWVEVEAIEGDLVRGRTKHEAFVLAIREGEPVEVRAGDVEDWVIHRGKERLGGFSEAAVDRWLEIHGRSED
jgi:uncharacterized protein YegJ (DUF2314 family)